MVSNPFNWIKFYRIEIIVILLALLHQVLQKGFHLKLGWVDNYGDDLLAVPFVSACILLLENFLVYRNHTRKHSFSQLLFLFVFITIFFEFIAPKISTSYTFDWLDILFYFFGLIFLSFKFFNTKASH